MLSRRQLMNDKIVSAQGENLSLVNVKGSKLNALSVYGKSTQDGTPSPDNPVPIVSAGDSGEINVNVGGKNLIPFPYLSPLSGAGTVYEADGVTYTVQADGGIKCVGTPTSIFGPTLCKTRFSEEPLNANNSESVTNGKVTLLGGPLYFDPHNNATFIYWTQHQNIPVDMIIYPQLEVGTVATAYEPYKTPQTLTLSTPGGLPGIPVDSGGNYTDENGQQWVCDEIDLKRGKYIQRVGSVLADGTVNKFTASADNVFWNLNTDHTAPGVISGQRYLSIYFSKDLFDANEPGEFIYVLSEKGQEYFDTIEDLNAFCVEKNAEGNPLIIYYPMDPIETDLPAEEIAAYQALHTYTPNTSVGNDADAGVKIGYREWRR